MHNDAILMFQNGIWFFFFSKHSHDLHGQASEATTASAVVATESAAATTTAAAMGLLTDT